MKTLISMRSIKGPYQTFDGLERAYSTFFSEKGFALDPVANNLMILQRKLDSFDYGGIILTGGNDLGEDPVRDAVERRLLAFAERKKVPVLGICRGLQVIHSYFGGKVVPYRGELEHVAAQHQVTLSEEAAARFALDGWQYQVNSFHNNVLEGVVSDDLHPFAVAEDGTIEGLYHKNLPIVGVMWHPERTLSSEHSIKSLDIALVEDFRCSGIRYLNHGQSEE